MRVDQANTSKVLDVEGTLARFGGDKDLFREMAGIVIEDAPRLAKELRAGVLAADSTAIQMKAHALKGLVLGCGGERTGLTAQKLEDAGKDHRLEAATTQMADCETELRHFLEAIRPYAQGKSPG